MIKIFANGKRKTRVVPLAVPTGWGKTKIAIQSIFSAEYNKIHSTYRPTIIFWPQKRSHLKEVWGIGKEDGQICAEWKGLVDDDLNLKNDFNYDRYYVTTLFKNYWRCKKGSPYWNEKVRKEKKSVEDMIRESGPGPIVFIVDEWHTDGILEAFNDFLNGKKASGQLAEDFIREFFLLSEFPKKKLFVLLLSATPISLTKAMDDDNESAFEDSVNFYVNLFSVLASVGNQKMVYNLYKNYPKAVEEQEKKLSQETSGKISARLKQKNNWINAYCETAFGKKGFVYAEEQYAFAKKDSLKLQALKNLLKRYGCLGDNPKHKIVIFCHYEKVANGVCEYLTDNGVKVCFLQPKHNKRKLIIDTFNGEVSEEDDEYDSEYDFPILILMDRDSQGLSLHKQEPWLIHYELAWNPIRIIQRFGRVWRFIKKEDGKLKLTKPKVFHLPFTYSSEEEQINRLKRRWIFLDSLKPNQKKEEKKTKKNKMNSGKKNKTKNIMMDLSPISMKYALGRRWTPEPQS